MGLLLDLNQLASAAVESGLLMPNQLQKLMLITVMVDTDVMDMVDTDTDVDTDMEDTDTISVSAQLNHGVTDILMDSTDTHTPMDQASLDTQEQPPPMSPEAHKVSASKLSY